MKNKIIYNNLNLIEFDINNVNTFTINMYKYWFSYGNILIKCNKHDL